MRAPYGRVVTLSTRRPRCVGAAGTNPVDRYLPPGRGVGGVEPPRPSWIPILIDGVLIWSGEMGRGAITTDLPEGHKPEDGLQDHQSTGLAVPAPSLWRSDGVPGFS